MAAKMSAWQKAFVTFGFTRKGGASCKKGCSQILIQAVYPVLIAESTTCIRKYENKDFAFTCLNAKVKYIIFCVSV